MGLIKELALLPVAPLRFTVWVADKVGEQVEQERGAGAAAQGIQALEEARERGELAPDEAERRQGELLEEQLGGPAAPTEERERRG